ncbi:histone acetyltransferases subunit 3-domain-containing protein [Ilyonectria robusta]|uniref:histone acetyltransferases subunit 3-domain-containing protein n=1 Tax=Ilyonectria robusta TaxID=1079257 RepID=UPI001E8CA338|nr:histone acetyltransferases subunit 3-domain-containing protein [Ilyonectria robusta]KAH8734731.1 histone acetyltransferases subunit 3-domain-containing protein [Ilyonectria robusta]
MPPGGPAQKGTGKKNSAAMQKQSRNTTPAPAATAAAAGTASLPPQEFYDPDYLNTRVILFRNLTYDDLVDQSASNATVPDSKSLDGMIERLKSLTNIMEKRSTFYDRGMRHLADERKKRPTEDYDRGRAEGEQEGKRPKHKRKKTDSLAAPDGNVERSSPLRDSKSKHTRNESASSSLSPAAAASPSAMEVDDKTKKQEGEEESSSEDEGAPPRREVPQSQTFGEDPSTFPDPTVYEIRPVYPGMPDDLRKEIYSVATYPRSDLADLIAGDPPDKDFSNAKPSSQINFSTFSTYVDPFFRPFSEEDLAFLRERGDRVMPFVMPKRGKRHYTEVWAEEDGAMSVDSPQQGRDKLPPNQPRGGIENMDDDVGETDKLSVGPWLARLMQTFRPEARAQPAEEKPTTNGVTNGDISMNGDANGEEHTGGTDDKSNPLQPATYMPESMSEAWKKATHPKLEYSQVDERIKQELRHIGFLPLEGFEAEFDGHYDDEVAARLRLLQSRLKEQMLINGARKSRLTDLVRERMAHQEYQTILEDLDSQVQAAYLKRTRTMGKSKKNKRPGGAGGGSHFVGGAAGTARPGIGDLTKMLMERRRRWIDTIGSVFDDESLGKVPRATDPESSIFKSKDMADLIKKEKEQWDEEDE